MYGSDPILFTLKISHDNTQIRVVQINESNNNQKIISNKFDNYISFSLIEEGRKSQFISLWIVKIFSIN